MFFSPCSVCNCAVCDSAGEPVVMAVKAILIFDYDFTYAKAILPATAIQLRMDIVNALNLHITEAEVNNYVDWFSGLSA